MFTDEFPAIVQVRFEKVDNYRLFIPSDKNWWKDNDYLKQMKEFNKKLNKIITSKNINITLFAETMLGYEEIKLD